MKTKEAESENYCRVPASLLRACLNTCDAVGDRIEAVRGKIFHEYQKVFGMQERVLRLALNEAEALAWQTDFPHLVFPTLALEKADAAAHWHQRQKTIRPRAESAFAA